MRHEISAIVNLEVIQSIGDSFTRLLTLAIFWHFSKQKMGKTMKKQRTLTWWLDMRERGKGSDKWFSVSCRTMEWTLSFLRRKHRRRSELVGWGWVEPRSVDSEVPLGSNRECLRGSSVTQPVKSQPAMQETQETRVRSLGQEDPLEKGMAAHSSILAWRIPWTEEPGRPQPMGSQSQTRLSD